MAKATAILWKGILGATRLTSCAALVFMVVTTGYDTVARYAGLHPTDWSMEINSFLIVYVTAMGAAEALRTGKHIGISLLRDRLPRPAQTWIRVAEGILGTIFSLAMAWNGAIIAYNAWLYDETVSSSFGTPLVYPYAIVPIGFLLLAIQFLLQALGVAPVTQAAEASDRTPAQLL